VRGKKVDGRADIFALGLILNEMFTATVPLAAGHPTIANVAPQFEYVDKIVERMLQYDPAKRYQTIEKLKEELIVRGNAFVELQKLDKLRREVVAASSPDDPLHGDDVKVTAYRYTLGEMLFELEPIPTPSWLAIFNRHLSTPTARNGFQENYVESHRDGTIGIKATELTATNLVSLVKRAVEDVNRGYKEHLTSQAAEAHRRRVATLERQRAQAEEIERVNRRLQDLV
jgi:serine/threonine protein kinase